MSPAQYSESKLKKERILQTSLELTLRWMREPINNYFELLDDRLFKLAQNSDNNKDQADYFQARGEITNNRANINHLFIEYITKAFSKYQTGQQTSTNFNLDPEFDREKKLSLVNEQQLEEALAIATMSRKSSSDCSELIYSLNQRFSVLGGGTKINEQENPIAPGVFAEALQFATTNLTLENQSKLIVYKVFEFNLITQLHSLYKIINEEFKNQGVLPNLGFHVKKNAALNHPNDQNIAPPRQEQTTNTAVGIGEQFQANNDFQSAQNQLRLVEAIHIIQAKIAAQTPVAANNRAIALTAAQIIAAFQQLQKNAGIRLNSLEGPTAIAESNTVSPLEQTKQFAQKSENSENSAIEIVGLLFEYMLNEDRLSDATKTLLSYLHTPFLKVAVMDKDFFKHPEHPARLLLNSLVAAGANSVDSTGKHKSELFEKIKSIVQRLLDGYSQDVRLFSELSFDFNQYLREHTRRIQLTEKRSMQAAQGETRLKEIRLKINAYLKSRIVNIELPRSVTTLLFEPWANFLSFNLLRFGSSSEQWKQAAQTVDDIIWYCQPYNTSKDIHAKVRNKELQHSLPPVLKAGFETVGYSSSQGQELINLLLNRTQILSTSVPSAPSTITQNPVTNIDDINIHQATDIKEKDSLVSRINSLKPGIWFNFEIKSKKPTRVKLSWVNTSTQELMFVNTLGQQVSTKTAKQIATGMRRGDMKIQNRIKEKPFFESAMERVLEQLKKKEKMS